MYLKIILFFKLTFGVAVASQACAIFILTDATRTLFFNNEDFSNPATRIWFLPGGKGYYGAAYVGFDNDWAQGGVNTAGVAFDWVAGYNNEYIPPKNLIQARGNNPSQRMLESCGTVDEAIAFFKRYKEPAFSYARIMIGDKTGASVIISVKDGRLFFDKSERSRGFGYGEKSLIPLLEKTPAPTVANGLPILNTCSQKGQFATKYSSIYDLRSGDIFLIPAGQQKETKINLSDELAKGAHYYDMNNIQPMGDKSLLSLRPNMKRFIADGLKPVVDPDSAIDNKFKLFFTNTALGKIAQGDFAPELWKQIGPGLASMTEETRKLGEIKSFVLVEKKEEHLLRSYLYLMEVDNFIILQRFGLNQDNKLTELNSEGYELKIK